MMFLDANSALCPPRRRGLAAADIQTSDAVVHRVLPSDWVKAAGGCIKCFKG